MTPSIILPRFDFHVDDLLLVLQPRFFLRVDLFVICLEFSEKYVLFDGVCNSLYMYHSCDRYFNSIILVHDLKPFSFLQLQALRCDRARCRQWVRFDGRSTWTRSTRPSLIRCGLRSLEQRLGLCPLRTLDWA